MFLVNYHTYLTFFIDISLVGIFFYFEFLLSVNGFSVRNTGAETPRRCEQVTPYLGRVCSLFFFFLIGNNLVFIYLDRIEKITI